MGSSPSADLFYGYDLGDLTDPENHYEDLRPQWWQDDEEWEEVLARKLGWIEVPYPDFGAEHDARLQAAGWEERDRMHKERRETPEYKAWSDNRSEMHRLARQRSCSIDTYGYSEEPSWAVMVDNAGYRAWDYGSCKVKDLLVDPTWDAKLAEFVELLEIPIPEGVTPGWHMTCSYG